MLLKEHFILERIAEEEKIEDLPEDYEAEIVRIAVSSNDSPRRVRARMERAGQMDVLRNMIIERKVIELIEENAQVRIVPAKPFAHETVEAIDVAIGGTRVEHIPEAKYDDQPQQPIPGSAAATAKSSIG
jgi:trigger factor